MVPHHTFMALLTSMQLAVALQPGPSAPRPSRRAAVSLGAALVLSTTGPADAFVGPLSSLGMRAAREKQKACYDALECASEVPYYDIVCSRDDTECMQRKRRLASEALQGGPGFEVITVFALFALGGPINALARAVRALLNRE